MQQMQQQMEQQHFADSAALLRSVGMEKYVAVFEEEAMGARRRAVEAAASRNFERDYK